MTRNEITYQLISPQYMLAGRKPIAVLFGDERIEVILDTPVSITPISTSS